MSLSGRLSWRPLSFQILGLIALLIGKNLLIEFELFNQPLDFLHPDIARDDQSETDVFCQQPCR